MLEQRLTTPLRVPAVWRDLLNLDEFGDDVPKKPKLETTRVDDPQPYKYDAREVRITEGEWTVQLYLCSGDMNYCIAMSVDGPDDVAYESEPWDTFPPVGDDEVIMDMGDHQCRLIYTLVVEGDKPPKQRKLRSVEYFRLWGGDSGHWDTDFIKIPSDTPREMINEAIIEAAAKIQWRDDCGPPTIVGLYSETDPDGFDENHDGSVCENCGAPCEYDSEMCLCSDCSKQAAFVAAVLKPYIVTFVDGQRVEEFCCQAEDEEHAKEQCVNAYPGVTITAVRQEAYGEARLIKIPVCPICGGEIQATEERSVYLSYEQGVHLDPTNSFFDESYVHSVERDSNIRSITYYCENDHTEKQIIEAVLAKAKEAAQCG